MRVKNYHKHDNTSVLELDTPLRIYKEIYGQHRACAPNHVGARRLAFFLQTVYSPFAYGSGIHFVTHTQWINRLE